MWITMQCLAIHLCLLSFRCKLVSGWVSQQVIVPTWRFSQVFFIQYEYGMIFPNLTVVSAAFGIKFNFFQIQKLYLQLGFWYDL